MPNASARGFKTYIRLKGQNKAKEFQKLRVEEWLDDNLNFMPLSDL